MRRQPRPRLDLDPPALVVGQVQVQPVQLVQRQQVDVALDVGDAEEVARDVEHRAAPREARPVADRPRSDRARAGADATALDLGRQQLAERLDAPEEAGGAVRDQRHAVRFDSQLVALVAVWGGRLEREVHVADGDCPPERSIGSRYPVGGRNRPRAARRRGAPRSCRDARVGPEREHAAGRRDGERLRDHAAEARRPARACGVGGLAAGGEAGERRGEGRRSARGHGAIMPRAPGVGGGRAVPWDCPRTVPRRRRPRRARRQPAAASRRDVSRGLSPDGAGRAARPAGAERAAPLTAPVASGVCQPERDGRDLAAHLAARVAPSVDVHVRATRLERGEHGRASARRCRGRRSGTARTAAPRRARRPAGADVDVCAGGGAGQAVERQPPDERAGRPDFVTAR